MFESSKKIGIRPSIAKKLEWLKDIIEKLIEMDRYYNTPTGTTIHMNLSTVEELLHNIRFDKLPQKKDMIRCNEMLKYLKGLYAFNIDWRGNIINCDRYVEYTLNKGNKMNMLYSWNQ